MLLGLRTVVYHVSNLDEAKHWYAKVSGVAPYFDEPFYVGFNIGGFELGLYPESDPVSEPASEPAPQARSAARTSSTGAVAYWGVHACQGGIRLAGRQRRQVRDSAARCRRPYLGCLCA